ncbi:unnamed protein product [Rotaria sordida]|uniref:WW domain-containing protein n=1 Tax=Rotaria sordida TaxID=392033 RepID=A0A814IPB3_9BILA|nr:unnamed protein product [Rotaria sordida]
MALSSVSCDFNRDNSPSLSSLSPTVIHYRQKYEKRKISQYNHREVRKHYHFEKQHNRNRSHRNTSFRQHNHRSLKRRQSPCLWEEHKSSNGRIYYYNIITDQSQWEKPTREQLSSSIKIRSINKNDFHSKRSSNNNNYLFVNNGYYSKKSNLISISNENFNSTRDRSSHSDKKSSIYQRSVNKNDRNKSMRIDYHKRKKDNIEVDSSYKKFVKDKNKNDDIILLTPTSPPPNEIIQIDHVDPLPTSNNSLTNISIPFIINSSKKSHYDIFSNSLIENIFKLFHRKQSIKTQINKDISSSIIIPSSLRSSSNTINAIIELEHSPSIILPNQYKSSSTITNSNSNDIKRYYRADLIQHLLNWPSTQIEREIIHLSNEQTRIRTCQLTSLRTDLYSIRLRLERNRFQLLKYHHILTAQQHLINQLQLIDSD